MMIFLLIIPLLTVISALSLYRFNGRRQFMKFDLVQFVYAFIISPLVYIWVKSFTFSLLQTEVRPGLSVGQLFVIDSILSLLFIYVYAFVVIHSLTKSFKMRSLIDPLYDLFHHSEYFHLWLSHIVMFSGGVVLILILSTLNAFVAWPLYLPKAALLAAMGLGVIAGIGMYIGALLSNPLQKNFMRLMKLLFGAAFVIQVAVYFIVNPGWTADRWLYWLCFMAFTTTVVAGITWHRSSRATSLLEKFKDLGWGFNIDLSKKK